MNNIIITSEDIKQAVKKGEFRKLFPHLKSQFDKYISKPGCGTCVKELIESLSTETLKLKEYFGDVEFDISIPESFDSIQNVSNFKVINCSILELEDELNKLPMGAYQITASRYEDKITAIINRLD